MSTLSEDQQDPSSLEERVATPSELAPKKTELVMVKNSLGKGERSVARGSDGKFKKSKQRAPDGVTSKRIIHNRLQAVDTEDPKKRTQYQKSVDNMIALSQSTDPKNASASVKAFELLLTRGYGRPDASNEALEAEKESGIRTIVYNLTPLPTGVQEDKPRVKPEPDFINAEVVLGK